MSEKAKFIPFHAINEFMRNDYRLAVITEVLAKIDQIPSDKRSEIVKNISKYVTIQGFRNSNLAPVGRKAKASVTLFENSPEFSSCIVESWSKLHLDMAKTMYEVLTAKKWENVQPVELDRSKLPGFQIQWPKADTFEEINKSVKALDSKTEESDDNISLMAVWIGNRLPYELYGNAAEEKEG